MVVTKAAAQAMRARELEQAADELPHALANVLGGAHYLGPIARNTMKACQEILRQRAENVRRGIQ